MSEKWSMRVIESSTYNGECKVAIKKEKMKLLYHEIPKTGIKVPLEGTETFIKTLRVYKVE